MFAQAESESISQNVKMGIKAKMNRVEFVGCPKCYGYNWNKQTKELEVNEEQARAVRKTIEEIDGIMPENLATPEKSIKQIEKEELQKIGKN